MNKKLEKKENMINDEEMSQVTGGLVNKVPSQSGIESAPFNPQIGTGNGGNIESQKNKNLVN